MEGPARSRDAGLTSSEPATVLTGFLREATLAGNNANGPLVTGEWFVP